VKDGANNRAEFSGGVGEGWCHRASRWFVYAPAGSCAEVAENKYNKTIPIKQN